MEESEICDICRRLGRKNCDYPSTRRNSFLQTPLKESSLAATRFSPFRHSRAQSSVHNSQVRANFTYHQPRQQVAPPTPLNIPS